MPFNNDRSQSVECIAMNLPALGKDFADLRLPIVAYPKFFLAKKKTWDCLFQILAWSFRSLLFDKWPSVRHDASPFLNQIARGREWWVHQLAWSPA